MLRFRFQLRPLSEITGWGTDGRDLHWFALTDGWYWIEIEGVELLRYDDVTLSRLCVGGLPYVDYYVVRLWEDLICQLPEMLEPVPPDLRDFIAGDSSTWAERDENEEDFVAAIADFDRRLMAAMEDRVGECERLGPPADRDLDVAWLRREHEQRRAWLADKGARVVTTDWDMVRVGARFLQAGRR